MKRKIEKAGSLFLVLHQPLYSKNIATMESTKPFSYDINYNPDADGMINNMDYGGLDLYSCVMEIKDNSDDKNASEIGIYMLTEGKESKKLSQLIMVDNGPGMTAEKLAHSIILAKRDIHGANDIGKFGMGLNNATMALGDKIVIISKTADGTSRGLYMDLAHMRRENTFKPTLICEGAEIFKALIARDGIYDAFMVGASGVLISVSDIKMNIEDVEVEAKKLQSALSLGYKTNTSRTCIYTGVEIEPLMVNEIDVFYRAAPERLNYQAETTLRVFLGPDKKAVVGVYEVLRDSRIKGKKNTAESSYYDGARKPLYFRAALKTVANSNGKIKYEHVHTQMCENDLPKGEYRDITLNYVYVGNDTYKAENNDSKFDGVPHRRRGLWFYRNTRCVGKCIELGSSLDDYSNPLRMEITYPPDLDYHMGMRIQKQMGTITSSAISDAIVVIWEQQNKELIRMRKRELKALKKAADDAEDEEQEQEEYDEDELLASFFPAGPIEPVKAKKPAVSPVSSVSPVQEQVEEEQEQVEEEQVEEEQVEEMQEQKEEIEVEDGQDEEQEEPLVQPVTPEPIENTKSKVAGHDRMTSKSEKDVILILQNLQALLSSNLSAKATNPETFAATEFTELWKSANHIINYLN